MSWGRRKFVTTLMTASGVFPLLFQPLRSGAVPAKPTSPAKPKTVQDVINLIIASIPGAPLQQTVDTIKAGSGDQIVKGIVTTMFATDSVIEKAAASGANFIIAHEPTFYNHADDTTWLQDDDVFKYKKALLSQHNITVWRFHDYIHAHNPDGIFMGVLNALGWQQYYDKEQPHILNIAPATLQQIIHLTKSKLGIRQVKYIGNPEQSIKKIALIPGAAGGRMQIEVIRKNQLDLLICGELNEWETSEYIRDLRYAGGHTSLLVLGHIVSEEPGLEWLVSWLQPQIPDIKVSHIPSGDAFSWG